MVHIIKNKKILVLAFGLMFTLVLSLAIGGKYLYEHLNTIQDNKYSLVASNIKNRTATLILDKHSSTTAITIALATSKNLIAFFHNQTTQEEFKQFSKNLATSTEYKNVWIQLLDTQGRSLYRTWDDANKDNIGAIRSDIGEVIKTKKIVKSISVGKYTMSFKSIVPVFDNGNFIGIVEIITHFNSISLNLARNGVQSIFVANKEYKNQITKPFSKLFIEDYYVANLHPDPEILTLLKNTKIDQLKNISTYEIINDYLITSLPLVDNNKKLVGYGLLFQNLKLLDNNDIETFKTFIQVFILLTSLLIIAVIVTLKIYKNREEAQEELQNELYYKTLLEEEVKAKTKDLEDLNNNLEQKIIMELEKNRKQDLLLQQQSRLAALGEMIGNIAHQWRQPLSAISSLASSLRVQNELGLLSHHEINDVSTSIIDKVNFLSHTIDDFRHFFQKDKQKESFNLSQTILKTFDFTKTSYDQSSIQIYFDLDEHISIDGHKTELQQVILNLLNNARDALNCTLNEKKIVFVSLKTIQNTIVRISVLDNGGGIPEHIINKIFDPYFTTKHKSQGTGLGLYMSSEIIISHFGGKFYVKNEDLVHDGVQYQGANFYIDLPKE